MDHYSKVAPRPNILIGLGAIFFSVSAFLYSIFPATHNNNVSRHFICVVLKKGKMYRITQHGVVRYVTYAEYW